MTFYIIFGCNIWLIQSCKIGHLEFKALQSLWNRLIIGQKFMHYVILLLSALLFEFNPHAVGIWNFQLQKFKID